MDTSIDSFKIVQAITAYLYRTQTYSVNFKGFRVPTSVGFPDSYNIGKQFEFTYGNTERIKVTFDVEVQSYLPVVDEQNEFFGGQQVSGFQANFGASFAGATGSGQNTVTGTNQAAQSTINNTVNNPQNSQSTSITPAAPASTGQVGGTFSGSNSQTLVDQNNYVTPPDLAQSGNIDVASTSASGKVKDANNNNTTEDESQNGTNGFKTDEGEYDGNFWK